MASNASEKSSGHGSHEPDAIRRKLEQVLGDRQTFFKSARASFQQFDKDESGALDMNETINLINRLCQNLCLPPLQDDIVQNIITRYDTSGDGMLDIDEFAKMYYVLLCRVKNKYYPAKHIVSTKDIFVKTTTVEDGVDIHEVFDFDKKLGSGSFGEVHVVKMKGSSVDRVCKIINKSKSQVPREQIDAEVEIMKNLDHPNIIKIFDVYEDYHNLYIIMEYCRGNELLHRILTTLQNGQRFTESFVAKIMRQLLGALACIHQGKVMHKDLKPENVLFVDDSLDSPLKVIDFGLAEMFEKESAISSKPAGTVLYMAPEMFQRKFNYKCDVWSAGVMMYLLLTGRIPFIGQTVKEVKEAVTNTEPPFHRDCKKVSHVAVDLLKKLLKRDPKSRPSAQEALEHPWFNQSPNAALEISPEIQENLKNFMKHSDVKNVIVNLVAHQLTLDCEQVRAIKELFIRLDADHSGNLSYEEVSGALTTAGVKQWDINRIVQAMDVDGTGVISYTEFLAACTAQQTAEMNALWLAFKKIDADGDGKITLEEFETLLQGGGGSEKKLLTREHLQQVLQEYDKNSDGVIDWAEFCDMVQTA